MNTFGLSSSQKYPLYDPTRVRSNRARLRRERIPELDFANSLCVPTGRWPSRGWLLVRRRDYDLLDRYSTALQLEVGDPDGADNVGVLKNLSVVQARCVTRGIEADEDAIYLVEVTDGRGVLHSEWMQHPLTKQYNVRSPAYPQTFYQASMNGGTTWTWSTMLQDMWGEMDDQLGPWPGLPTTPAGTPEGFWFPGVSGWTALCDVLDHLGLTVACDLTSNTPFTIVQPGAADASLDALLADYEPPVNPHRLEEDLEWIDVGAARVPGTVVVLFRRRNSVYGTEETVYYGNDSVAKQWTSTPHYSVSVSAPAAFSGATGTHHLWSDFTVRYDQNSDPVAADTATAATIAQERVDAYFARVYAQTLGRMSKTYIGALPFKTGPRVDGVCWYQGWPGGRAGWRTGVVRGIHPPWPHLLGRCSSSRG